MDRRTSLCVMFSLACANSPATDEDSGTTAGSSTGQVGDDGTTATTGASSTTAAATTAADTTVADATTAADSGSGEDDGGSSTGAPAIAPADLLDLAAWKLTLPIARDEPDQPLEILQPELGTYAIEPWFHLDDAATAVVFRANAGGVTTNNSGYPRAELREMANDGLDPASWSTSDGVHSMTITQAITHLPDAKPHVVAGQIHDASDDVVMIRLEGSHLFVEGGGDELGDLATDYVLGTTFTVMLRASEGAIDIFYEDLSTPVVSIERDVDGCYFKAGVYTQSNPEHGDEPDAYGEVVISELVVTHA
ncbi:MAG: polysaccharide lyase family 7 protein [Deltaproteobacteria bacterium]|nr:polysaccharide lyase family 7 protein [Deltaproteobacteria bacterium]